METMTHADHQATTHNGSHEPASGADHEAHDKHAGHDPAQFRNRFWLTLALTIPVVYFSEMFQELLGYEAIRFFLSEAVSPALGTLIFLYGGWPFLRGAVMEARWR
ncbi:MAG: heavy metal translocating P-type ATPase, partial [Actinomycetota bacterium]